MIMNNHEAIKILKKNRPSSDPRKCGVELCEAVDMAISALEKRIPTRQGNFEDNTSHLRLSKSGFVYCNVTNMTIRYPLISLDDLEYCPRCGQALNWKEEWEKEEWEKEEVVDEECLKCRHFTKDGCDTWCDHGETFEPEN